MTRRLKLLFALRLVPLTERNYNLVELGPRGTGKSYVIQEVSPYAALLTGGTTQASMFGHMNGRQKGMVQIWDVVGFDEVADLQKLPKEVVTTMKTYCESGTYQRGAGARHRRRQHHDVRQHQPADRRDGPDRPPVRAHARRHPRRHGLHRPPALLSPGLGDPQDAERPLHGPLRLRGGLPGRGAARAPQAQLHGAHRPGLRAGRPPQCPRPEGGPQDRLRPGQDPLPGRRGHDRRAGRAAGVRHRGPPAGEGAAQEDGLLRVLPDVLQLHAPGDRRRAVRGRARAGRPRPDLRGSRWRRGPSTRQASPRTAPWACSAWRSRSPTAPASSSSPAVCPA